MNTLYIRIKELTDEHHLSLAQLERELKFSNGIISTWKKGKASSDKIEQVADYFNVSTDYLLGRTDDPNIDKNKFSPKVQRIARNASHLSSNDLDKLNDVMAAIFKDKFDD